MTKGERGAGTYSIPAPNKRYSEAFFLPVSLRVRTTGIGTMMMAISVAILVPALA